MADGKKGIYFARPYSLLVIALPSLVLLPACCMLLTLPLLLNNCVAVCCCMLTIYCCCCILLASCYSLLFCLMILELAAGTIYDHRKPLQEVAWLRIMCK